MVTNRAVGPKVADSNLILLLSTCVTLCKLLDFSVPPFSGVTTGLPYRSVERNK